MKRLTTFLATSAFIALAFGFVGEASAQCCGKVCLSAAASDCPTECGVEADTVPLKAERCDPIQGDPTVMGGCAEVEGAACIGGRADGPSVGGCIGVGGAQFITDAAPPHGDAAECTQSAVDGCRGLGQTTREDDASCGYCPATDPCTP